MLSLGSRILAFRRDRRVLRRAPCRRESGQGLVTSRLRSSECQRTHGRATARSWVWTFAGVRASSSGATRRLASASSLSMTSVQPGSRAESQVGVSEARAETAEERVREIEEELRRLRGE